MNQEERSTIKVNSKQKYNSVYYLNFKRTKIEKSVSLNFKRTKIKKSVRCFPISEKNELNPHGILQVVLSNPETLLIGPPQQIQFS